MSQSVNVGLIGCGNIGTSFVHLLRARAATIESMNGIDLRLTRIAVRDPHKQRSETIDPALFTGDAGEVVDADDIDIVVEIAGGAGPVRELLLTALKAGKPVITANKELVAKHGPELYEAARSAGVDLFFEAAAVAAVPILRPLRESFQGEEFQRVLGIINGTTNYMLTRMSEDGIGYDEALAQAQALGYAEPDASADVQGTDAASKLAILASLAFKRAVLADDVRREGIVGLEQEDFQIASRFGFEIKSLAVAEAAENPDTGEREIGAQVFPALIDRTHPLASVRDSYNAVSVTGAAAGELMFYGHGAGQLPTSSALLGDLVAAADQLRRGTHRPVPVGGPAALRPADELSHAFYLKLQIVEAPGVLSEVTGILGRHGVSIRSITQEGRASQAKVVFITYVTVERALHAAVEELKSLESVREIGRVMRILQP